MDGLLQEDEKKRQPGAPFGKQQLGILIIAWMPGCSTPPFAGFPFRKGGKNGERIRDGEDSSGWRYVAGGGLTEGAC